MVKPKKPKIKKTQIAKKIQKVRKKKRVKHPVGSIPGDMPSTNPLSYNDQDYF